MAEFGVGDRIVCEDPLYELASRHRTVTGKVMEIDTKLGHYYVYVERDDPKENYIDVISHRQGWWMCRGAWCRLLPPVVQLADMQPKGYRPDGFNPDAHRAFLKTLGG